MLVTRLKVGDLRCSNNSFEFTFHSRFLHLAKATDLGILRGIRRGSLYKRKKRTLPRYTQNWRVREFFMRTMDQRNKILFTSQESSDELQDSPDILHNLFARIFQTGLRETIIRRGMTAFLLEDKMSDAELHDELIKTVRRASENKQKLGITFVSSENDELLAKVRLCYVRLLHITPYQRRRLYNGDYIYYTSIISFLFFFFHFAPCVKIKTTELTYRLKENGF